MKLIRITKNHGYKTSRDYEWLFELMQDTAVVCFVDHSSETRDIACTLFDGRCYAVSCRGTAYVWAYNKEEFIMQCFNSKLEFIEPGKRSNQTDTKS